MAGGNVNQFPEFPTDTILLLETVVLAAAFVPALGSRSGALPFQTVLTKRVTRLTRLQSATVEWLSIFRILDSPAQVTDSD